eukprot:jgi/Ulvmu1/4818/UM020_0103.1
MSVGKDVGVDAAMWNFMLSWAALALVVGLRCAAVLIIACIISRPIRIAIMSQFLSLMISLRVKFMWKGRRRSGKPIVSRNAEGLICIQDLDICDLLSGQQIKSACEGLPYYVEALRIESLRLGVPDFFRWQFDIECDGGTLELRQKAMPQSHSTPDDHNRLAGTMREKQRRLALVDVLLWGTEPGSTPSQPPRKRAGWLAALIHAALTLSMNSVSVKATKLDFTMFQDTVPGPWQPQESVTGQKHREGLSLSIRSISYGPLLPLSSKRVVDPCPKPSKQPPREKLWAQRMMPQPLLDVTHSRKTVAQVRLSVEGINAFVLSTLPNLVDLDNATTRSAMPAQFSAAPETALGQPEARASAAPLMAVPGSNDVQPLVDGAAATPGQRYLAWTVNWALFQQWGFTATLSSVPDGVKRSRAHARPEDVPSGGMTLPQKERGTMKHLARIPEGGSRSSRMPLGPQLSHHSSLSRFMPPSTPLGRNRASSFRRSFGLATPHNKPGISSRAFGPQSALPSFMRTFGTENLDKSTESVPVDVASEAPEHKAQGWDVALEGDEDGQGTGSIQLDLNLEFRALAPCVDIRSMGVLSRVALRTHLYNAMEVGWAARPKVRVSEDPRAWWRHALHMVLRECRKVRRRRVTLFAAARKRKVRQKYQALYRRLHQDSAHYTDPDRRWWKVWQLWQRRKPSFGLTREELNDLDAELPLDELLHYRLRTAMRYSHLLKSREYASATIRILNTIAVNAHIPLPHNTEAIMKGEPITPLLSNPSLPIRFCACVHIPRIGFNILLERPAPSVLFGMLTGCSVTLDMSSRCAFILKTAEVGIRSGHSTVPATDAHARGTHLLHSPCFSFAQLHDSHHSQHARGTKARLPHSTGCQTFLSGTFVPCGNHEDVDSELVSAPFDTIHQPFNAHTAAGGFGLSGRGGSHTGESYSDRDYVPSPSGSATSHDVPVIHEELRSSQRQRQARATELLNQRIQKLRGDILFGTVSATVAPVEAFIDSAALVRILELGLQLCTDLRQGDIFMQQAAGCGNTTLAALEAGKLPNLVHTSLVRHRIAIQGPSPPLLPLMSIDCGGIIVRLGMQNATVATADLLPSLRAEALGAETMDTSSYEFVFSVAALHGSLVPKIDLKHHAAATSAAYHMHATVVAVQAGFMQGGITPLLQDSDLAAIVRDAHEAATLAWQHPSDGDALLQQLNKGGAFDADDSDRKEYVREAFPHVTLQPSDNHFPVLPLFQVMGCAARSTLIIPLASSVAGNAHLALTAISKGAMAAVSPLQVRLLRHLMDNIDASNDSVNNRTAALVLPVSQRADTPAQEAPRYQRRRSSGQQSSKSAPPPAGNVHVTVAVHVPVAAAILFAPRSQDTAPLRTAPWASKVLSSGDPWSSKVQDAAGWASKLSPLAEFTVSDMRLGCDVRGTAAGAVTATCGGCLLVDLQPAATRATSALPQDALLLGPLPCRANNIANRAAMARKYMLGLPPAATVVNFERLTSRRGSSSRQAGLTGSTPLRPPSLERSSHPLGDAGQGPSAHIAASLWRRLSGELWLQNRCGYLLQAQAALSQAADPTFSTWNQVYDHVMRSDAASQPMVSLDLAASRSTANIEASASFVLQQLHSSVIFKGSESLLRGVSDLLEAAFEESTAARDRPASEEAPTSGGSPSSSARQSASAPGPCIKLRLSMLAVSCQVRVKAARRRFMDAVFRDSALVMTFAHDPHIAPEGELRCDVTAAAVSFQHGADMIDSGDVNCAILLLPAPPDVCTADAASSNAGPADSGSSDGGVSARSRRSRSESQLHADADVCLSAGAVHWVDMTGGDAVVSLPRAQVHLQAIRPLIRYQMRFLYDILHIIEHVRSLNDKYFGWLASDDSGQQEIEEADQGPAGTRGGDPPADSRRPEPFHLDLPVDIQVTVWDGALLVPESTGSRRAVAVTADTVVIGMPSSVLEPMDAPPSSDETRHKSDTALLGLPPIKTMMEASGRTLERHQRMSEVHHVCPAKSDSGDSTPAAPRPQRSGMDGVVSSGARVMRKWFHDKLSQAKGVVSGLTQSGDELHGAEEHREEQAASAAGSAPANEGDPAERRAHDAGTAVAGATADEQAGHHAAQPSASGEAPVPSVAPQGVGQDSAPSLQQRRVMFRSSAFPAARVGGSTAQGEEVPPGSAGDGVRSGAATRVSTAGLGCHDASHVPLKTGVDQISEPMFCFVASGYQIFGCRVIRDRQQSCGLRAASPCGMYVPVEESGGGGGARSSRQSDGVQAWRGSCTYGDIVPLIARGNAECAFAMRNDFAVHIHLASSPVWVFLSPASYWYIIDTCTGNFLENGVLKPGPPVGPSVKHRPYKPKISMWPAATAELLTTVTVMCAKSHLVLQGDPQTWEAGLPPRELLTAPRVPFARVDVTDFALSVLVTQQNGQSETFVLGDTQACHTYDLRLARYHLLYEPWGQGPAAVSGVERQNSARENAPEQRQQSQSTGNLRTAPGLAGILPRVASSQPGLDNSNSGDSHESVPPPLIYLQDLHESGVLHTGDDAAEYRSRVSEIEKLPPARRREASRTPVVHLTSAPVDHHVARNAWAAHLPRDNKPGAAIEAAFCVLGDMTMGLDVAMRHFQAFWPWAAEFGLLDAVLAIFTPAEKAAEGQPTPQLQPWMYVNIVLEHAQALVPISLDLLDVDAAVKTCMSEQEAFGTGSRTLLHLASRVARTSGATARVGKHVMLRPRMFQLMAQAMLNRLAEDGDVTPLYRFQRETDSFGLSTPFLSASAPRFGGSGQLSRPPQLMLPEDSLASMTQAMSPTRALVEPALAFTVQAVRYGLFYGEDGKSITLADVWSAAGHAVHRDVCMECWLLPCTLSAELQQETPLVEEQRKLQLLHQAAVRIQRWWRTKKMMMYLRETGMIRPDMARYDSSDSATVVAWGAVSGRLGAMSMVAVPQSASKVVDDLIYRRLNPGDRERVDHLLVQQKSTMDLGLPLGSTKRNLKVAVESCALRIAISHLVLHRLVKAQVPVIMAALQQPADGRDQSSSSEASQQVGAAAVEANRFRQSFNSVEFTIEHEVSAWLCNDGSHSFGAPDVLQGSITSMQVRAEVNVLRPDDRPTVRVRGDLRTSMRFLDIASGDWQWLLCPWQMEAEYLYVTAAQAQMHPSTSNEPAQIVYLQSRQHAIAHFTAASLLTVGDALAYGTSLMAEEDSDPAANGAPANNMPAGSVYAAVLGAATRPMRPSMDEQMALTVPLMERMPQRYCIQNHLGLDVWYWRPAPGPHASLMKHKLAPGQSQQMLCKPHPQQVTMAQSDGLHTSRVQSVISLLVEGNWLPISNVIVSQVGKYRYCMYSPHQSATVHVVVDVMLVGRTKVISLHSTVWLENSTDLPMRVRLHLPPSLLAVTPTVDLAQLNDRMGAARTVSGGPGAQHPSRSTSVGCMSTRSASRQQMDAYGKRSQQEGEIRRSGRDSDRFSRDAEGGNGSDVTLRILRPGSGQYLPLAAVLQSTISFTAQGHYENQRDVLQLNNDLAALPDQQGYLRCTSLPPLTAAAAEAQQPQRNIDPARMTHFFLRVSNKIRATGDLGALSQFEQVATDSFQPACSGVLASLTLKSPLRLTNALPFPAKYTVLEVWYTDTHDPDQPRLGGNENEDRVEFVSTVKTAAVVAKDWVIGLPQDPKLYEALFDKSSPIHAQATAMLSGRHIVLDMEKGAAMNLYADLNSTILVFLQIPSLHMRSSAWSVLSWGDADCGRGFTWSSIRPLAVPKDAKALPELPQVLHVVPDGVTFHERRRQVLRRLAHYMTCGMVPANKGVDKRFDPVMRHVHNATNATLAGLRRLDPSPHVAAAWETVQHKVPWNASDSAEGEEVDVSSAGADSSAASLRSAASSLPGEETPAVAGPSTRTNAGEEESDDEVYTVPGTRYTPEQARLLLSALHAWRYAKVSPGQRAPKSLFLGIANSGRPSSGHAQARRSCEVTVYSHYWVANSSCMPLVFNDRANANTQMTLPDMLDMSSMTAPGSVRDMKSARPGRNHFMVLPCLLNEQRRVRFCVPERYLSSSRRGPFGRSVNISVIGGQPTICLTGPDIPTDTPHAPGAKSLAAWASPAHDPPGLPPQETANATASSSGEDKDGSTRPVSELSLPDTQSMAQRLSTTEDSISLLLHSQGRTAVQGNNGATPAPSTVVTLAAASIPETGANTVEFEPLVTPQPAEVDARARLPAPELELTRPAGADGAAQRAVNFSRGQAGSAVAAALPQLPTASPDSSIRPPWGRADAGQRRPLSPLPVAIFAGGGQATSLGAAGDGAAAAGQPVATPGAAPAVPSPLGITPAVAAVPLMEDSGDVIGGDVAPLLQRMHTARPSEVTAGSSPDRSSGAVSSTELDKPLQPAAKKASKALSNEGTPGAGPSRAVAVLPHTPPAESSNSAEPAAMHSQAIACFGHGCNGAFSRGARVRRQYEMAVEVNSASAQSCFRFTKIVNVRDKYIIENQTGETLEVKQKGTPDPGIEFGPMRRSACQLPHGTSSPLFWDDDTAPKSITVRLAKQGQWEWSGGFELQEREDYFGLRIHRLNAAGARDGVNVILPVSISVEPSGVVLVSLKSQQNLPPYRICNACTSVAVSVSQSLTDGERIKPESLEPGKEVPFAWDEPTHPHLLRITASVQSSPSRLATTVEEDAEASTVLDIDKLPTKRVDPLTVKSSSYSQFSGPQELRSRLEGALAATVVRTVYIDIFADGPTRVVRFTDSGEELGLDGSIVAAWRRVRSIEQQLSVANQRFVALRGGAGISRIDLFGSAVPREIMTDVPAGPSASAVVMPTATEGSRNMSVAASGRLRQRSLNSGAPVAAPATAVVMMLAGDLTVSVVGVSGARGNLLVRLQAEEQLQHTTVLWNSDDPTWNESFTFFEMCAASELKAELWDIWSKNTAAKVDEKNTIDMGTLLEHSCFLGTAHVPLAETLPAAALQVSGNHTGPLLPGSRFRVTRECVLSRRHGGDRVQGTVTLAFDWRITATSILLQKYKVLKRVLATRNEILSMLAPQRMGESDEAVQNGVVDRGNDRANNAAAAAACRVSTGDGIWTLQAPQRHFDVSVAVLEVQNVPSRHSIGAAITANDAPLPSVAILGGGIEHVWSATARGTSATFGSTERRSFSDLPADATLRITLADGGDSATTRGVVTLALGKLDLTTPKYVWLEVERSKTEAPLGRSHAPAAVLRMLSDGAGALKSMFGVASAPPDLGFDPQLRQHAPMLLHMRLAATPRTTVSPTVVASVDLAGMGLLVSSGFEEELMAISFHSLALSAELAQRQAMLSAMVQGVQIDDQSLDARQPVVLSRANPMSKGMHRLVKHDVPNMTAHGVNEEHAPLFNATVIRSFAHRNDDRQRSPLDRNTLEASRPGPAAISDGPTQPTELGADDVGNFGTTGTTAALSSMMSFKEISVDLAPVDLTAHEAFLTSLFSFMMQLPLDDIWQDEEWQKRNRAAIMSTEVSHDARLAQQSVAAAQRELHELRTYEHPTGQDDSVLGSWFFIENFRISDIHSNVTVSISSHIMATARLFASQAGQDDTEVRVEEAAEQASNLLGVQFTRLIASSGFQLINVNNVAIQLKGKALDSKLLNTNSLVALLVRHYFRQGVKESHKILGGTGPAIAQIPLTFVWAGGTVFDLTLDLASRRAGALSALPRMGFITLTSVSQLVGVASKMAIAFLAVLPYERTGDLSDAAAMARYLVRPANAVEAFGMATKAFLQGFLSALVGLVSDPAAGLRKGNVPGLCLGAVKGTVGLGLRPVAGLAESCSKASQGMALACLGRQGIQGRTARRMYAPGTMRRLQHDREGVSAEQQEAQQEIQNMWQRSLASVHSKLRGDRVENVLTVRPRRVLVLTNRHVVYCQAKYLDRAQTVRLRWLLDCSNVNNILGDESRFTVLVRATKVVHIPCAGAWRIPVTKRVRTQSLEVFESVAGVLNDQVTDPAHARLRHTRTTRASTHATHNLPLLRITSAVEEVKADDEDADEVPQQSGTQ